MEVAAWTQLGIHTKRTIHNFELILTNRHTIIAHPAHSRRSG